jgi:hypothetical protein
MGAPIPTWPGRLLRCWNPNAALPLDRPASREPLLKPVGVGEEEGERTEMEKNEMKRNRVLRARETPER